jgi:O-acetyl-ADP-ribose deacetylase (regulator of RNase III)
MAGYIKSQTYSNKLPQKDNNNNDPRPRRRQRRSKAAALTQIERKQYEQTIQQLKSELNSVKCELAKCKAKYKNKDSSSTCNVDYTKRAYTPFLNQYIDTISNQSFPNPETPALNNTNRKCKIIYIQGDLLQAEEGIIAHAVAADLHCSAGIALQIKTKFGPPTISKDINLKPGDVVENKTNKSDTTVLNVVTKYESRHKLHQNPNQFIKNFNRGLIGLRRYCKTNTVKQLAIPRIGSGLDQLSWVYVEEVLCKTFFDLDINVVVYDPPQAKTSPSTGIVPTPGEHPLPLPPVKPTVCYDLTDFTSTYIPPTLSTKITNVESAAQNDPTAVLIPHHMDLSNIMSTSNEQSSDCNDSIVQIECDDVNSEHSESADVKLNETVIDIEADEYFDSQSIYNLKLLADTSDDKSPLKMCIVPPSPSTHFSKPLSAHPLSL